MGGVAGQTTSQAGAAGQAVTSPGGATATGGTAGSGGVSTAGGTGGQMGAAGAPAADSGTASQLPFGHPSPGATYPTYDGFTLWLVEDFDAPLDLDHDPVWTWSDGGFQTHRFTRDAISFDSGHMIITLSETPQVESCSYSNQGMVPATARTSGELRSRYNTFRYGRYEARVKAPSVQPNDAVTNGNYISSLFIFRQPGCQEWREIDLEVTGDSPSNLVTNVIHGNQTCATTEIRQDFALQDANFRTDFQTIGFEWLPGKVRYYRFDSTGAEVTLRTVMDDRVPELPAKIMANLWVFNSSYAFGGMEGSNDVFPLHNEYDFIRFYRWDGDMNYPCDNMDAACLPAADLDLAGNNGCDGIPNTGDLTACMQCGATVHVACTATCP